MRAATAAALCAGWIMGAGLSAACARSPVVVEPEPPPLDLADAEVANGCYDCLLEARDAYERIAETRGGSLVLSRLFEVNLLLALREKELALDPSASLAAAQALAPELPPAFEGPHAIAIVEAVPPEQTGLPERTHRAFLREHGDFRERAAEEIAWLQMSQLRGPVRTYLELAVACAYLPGAVFGPRSSVFGVTEDHGPETVDDPSLIRFKRATCTDRLDTAVLAQLRAREPRFAEASLAIARVDAARANREGPGQGGSRFAEAFARFPGSPAVTFLYGFFHHALEDCEQAVPLYSATLDLEPEHERALLGQVACLSLLGRHDEAIRAATTLIALDTSETRDAYYWRAWNHHQLKALDQARQDIDSARLRGASSRIYTLAGIVEHDQGEFDPAERDLTRALGMSRGNCAAMWYLGQVYHAREEWARGSELFDDATDCSEEEAEAAEAAILSLEARADLPADYRERLISRRDAEREASVTQQHAAAFNAAYGYAMAGDVASARRALEIAAREPRLAEKVNTLRAVLEGR